MRSVVVLKILVQHIGQYIHSHNKRKFNLEKRAVMSVFSLELEISGVTVQRINQNSEKWWLLREISYWNWLWGYFNYSLRCYGCCANTFEAVQKFATDEKEYHKCFSCVINCWIAKIYIPIDISEKILVTRTPLM